jgi:hypothetical protein
MGRVVLTLGFGLFSRVGCRCGFWIMMAVIRWQRWSMGNRDGKEDFEAASMDEGSVRNVVGIRSGIISEKLIISYYAARSNC